MGKQTHPFRQWATRGYDGLLHGIFTDQTIMVASVFQPALCFEEFGRVQVAAGCYVELLGHLVSFRNIHGFLMTRSY